MKLIVVVLAVSCMASFGTAETAPKYGAKPPPYKPNVADVQAPGSSDIDKCGCHQIVGKLKKVEANLLKLILNLRNKYGAVYSELLDMKKQVKGVTWYVGQTAATSQSINDQLANASANLAQIMYSIRELTINQQSLVTKTFLTESILDLEGRQESSGVTPPPPEGDIIYTSCDDPRITETGTYLVQDAFDVPTKLICVLEFGPGAYTVFQNRQDGSTDFYRGYNDYKAGFGEFDGGDYWLGLDRIHNITASGDYEMFILLEDFEKNISYARYDSFQIGAGSDFYPILKLEGFSGPAGDSFGVVEGVLFSTYDLDLDNSDSNCAVTNRGAWWYTDCGNSNLNGLYLKGLTGGTTGMSWSTFRGPNYSLKKSRMMVKRKVPVEPTTLPPVTDGPITGPTVTEPPTTVPPSTVPATTSPATTSTATTSPATTPPSTTTPSTTPPATQ